VCREVGHRGKRKKAPLTKSSFPLKTGGRKGRGRKERNLIDSKKRGKAIEMILGKKYSSV